MRQGKPYYLTNTKAVREPITDRFHCNYNYVKPKKDVKKNIWIFEENCKHAKNVCFCGCVICVAWVF